MLLTEEQMREKWCPMLGGKDLISRHDKNVPFTCRCIASDCAAWRWTTLVHSDGERRGYCGLVGRPEGA